jgi:hypothetical protein
MNTPQTTADLLREIDDPEYQAAISRGLDTALRTAFVSRRPFRIGADRMIIFSDLHKGARNDADDFRRCERAYNAALGYYYALGYWLVELGDVEELWEERARTVISKYERTLRLSAKFHIDPEQRGSRYLRLWEPRRSLEPQRPGRQAAQADLLPRGSIGSRGAWVSPNSCSR